MKFDAEAFKASLSARLKRQYGKDISQATKHDLFDAVSASAMEIITENGSLVYTVNKVMIGSGFHKVNYGNAISLLEQYNGN